MTGLYFRLMLLLGFAAGLFSPAVFAALEPDSVPVFHGLAADPNEYYLYADGGWDGNWFVGYSNCWIVKLPPVTRRDFKKAYIGARLGRAKGQPVPGRPWEKKPAEGKLYMGLSKDGGFNSRQSYLLVDSADIPLEAQPKETIKGLGGAQWFWTEVPAEALSSSRPNYLAIWAESDVFADVTNSPVIAGAPRKNATEYQVWLNTSQRGTPPRDAKTAFEQPIKNLVPAMAIKLVPQNDLEVLPRALRASYSESNITFAFSVIGQDISKAWLELSYDKFNWQRYGRYMFEPPYSFTVVRKALPKGKYYIRAGAVDMLENVGYSEILTMSGPVDD